MYSTFKRENLFLMKLIIQIQMYTSQKEFGKKIIHDLLENIGNQLSKNYNKFHINTFKNQYPHRGS